MRKFLLPIINLVNVILISIAFGLSPQTAVIDKALNDAPKGNYYQLVWGAADKANVIGIVGFFLFVAAVALMLVNFLPIKARKVTSGVTGALFIAAGVLFTKTQAGCVQTILQPQLTGAFMAMIVLTFIAGAFSLVMSVLEITAKNE